MSEKERGNLQPDSLCDVFNEILKKKNRANKRESLIGAGFAIRSIQHEATKFSWTSLHPTNIQIKPDSVYCMVSILSIIYCQFWQYNFPELL